MSGILIDSVFGCRLWQGKLDKDGYGFHGRSRAHIVLWEAEHGPVPEGFELEHRCRRRNCVALHHLEVVTRSVNEQRKSWANRVRQRRCPAGHDMTINAVVTPEGGRVCRQCNRDAEGRTT